VLLKKERDSTDTGVSLGRVFNFKLGRFAANKDLLSLPVRQFLELKTWLQYRAVKKGFSVNGCLMRKVD
jgi:hypothetical protein